MYIYVYLHISARVKQGGERHGCLSYNIPHFKGVAFGLHKDHVHKDLLDCTVPPPLP